jgi:hypothetical protein
MQANWTETRRLRREEQNNALGTVPLAMASYNSQWRASTRSGELGGE